MQQNNSKINWFPGHMKIAVDKIKKMYSTIDLILEIVDARGICISSNQEIISLLKTKPILQVALKSDLADLNSIKNTNSNLIVTNKYQKNLRNLIIKKFEELTLEKTKKLKLKGLIKPIYNVIVIGLPNVGKSTIINVLTKRNKMKVENYPGITRNISWTKLNDKFNIYDTPGVFFKKIDDFSMGAKLTLMGIIKNEVVPINEILFWAFEFLKRNYIKYLDKYINWDDNFNYQDFLIAIAKKRNFVMRYNEYDSLRASHTFLNDLMNGNIGKLNYEKI